MDRPVGLPALREALPSEDLGREDGVQPLSAVFEGRRHHRSQNALGQARGQRIDGKDRALLQHLDVLSCREVQLGMEHRESRAQLHAAGRQKAPAREERLPQVPCVQEGRFEPSRAISEHRNEHPPAVARPRLADRGDARRDHRLGTGHEIADSRDPPPVQIGPRDVEQEIAPGPDPEPAQELCAGGADSSAEAHLILQQAGLPPCPHTPSRRPAESTDGRVLTHAGTAVY